MATMQDVAAHSGVSIGTVSRCINGSGYVSAAARERIAAAVAAVGFVPNNAARSLVTKRTGLLGLVVSDLRNPFAAELAHGISSRAGERNLCVLTSVTDDREDNTLRVLQVLQEHQVDGVIVTPAETPRVKRRLTQLATAGLPLVLIGMRLRAGLADRVTTATYEGARAAIGHLVALGHRRIALIAGQQRRRVAMGRFRGYRDELAAAGLTVRDELVAEVPLDHAGGANAVDRLLALRRAPTAIFATNDAAALGALQRATALGVRVPDELSIVGFDDIELAAHAVPPLTTVHQPHREMGAVAVDLMADRIERGTAPVDRRLDCRLVVRSSTAGPPTGRVR